MPVGQPRRCQAGTARRPSQAECQRTRGRCRPRRLHGCRHVARLGAGHEAVAPSWRWAASAVALSRLLPRPA
eukprot:10123394-Lingulodinium_polyedra.AAC.1